VVGFKVERESILVFESLLGCFEGAINGIETLFHLGQLVDLFSIPGPSSTGLPFFFGLPGAARTTPKSMDVMPLTDVLAGDFPVVFFIVIS
jgi:hypothetical protein